MHWLENTVLDIVDARCNHEVYCGNLRSLSLVCPRGNVLVFVCISWKIKCWVLRLRLWGFVIHTVNKRKSSWEIVSVRVCVRVFRVRNS